MANEPFWLSPEQILIINRNLVAATGEPFIVLNRSLLESACARPQHHWRYGQEDFATLVCVLMFGIARNHPFAQGNKRAAFAAGVIFAEHNGYRVNVPDSAEFADKMVSVIEGAMDEAAFIDLFRKHLRALNV